VPSRPTRQRCSARLSPTTSHGSRGSSSGPRHGLT